MTSHLLAALLLLAVPAGQQPPGLQPPGLQPPGQQPPAGQQPPPAQLPPSGDAQKPATARIAGRVIAADTGKPLRWAQVHLVTFEQGRQVYAGTDAQGRYEFTALAPGRYRVDVRAERYVPLEFGQRQPPEPGKPIDLRDGEVFDKADFALPRAGAIEGQLLDEFGDPAPNIIVQLARLQFVAGRRRLMPIEGRMAARPTDDKGQFRIFGLVPGDYYVSALAGAFTEQNETGGFAPTYYPGTPDAASARPVPVGFGQEVTNIALPLVPARMARLSGSIVDATGRPVDAGLFLTLSDRLGVSDLMIARGFSRGGSFTFRNVPPGTYVIQALGPSPTGAPGQASFGWLPVTVNGENLPNLVVTIPPERAVRGRILFDDDTAAQPKPNEVSIFPRPIEFDSSPIGGGPPRSVIRDDWTFEVGNMSGLRVVQVNVRGSVWTLKRLTLDGKDVTDTPIDFRKGKDVEGLEVVLTSRGASLSGSVVDRNGRPVANYSVIVFAADSGKWAFPSRFVQLARPNQDGRFSLQGLPPEEYLAIALPLIQGTEWQDPQFLETIRAGARALTLSEGETKTLTVSLKE